MTISASSFPASEAASTEPASAYLVKLAMRSAATWHALGRRLFPGELSVETANSTYRFNDGVFLGRARRPARWFDAPRAMRGLRLVGFLADEGGLYSLSPRWREGAHAVLWKPGEATDERSFTLTSPVVAVAAEEPEPKPTPWVDRPPPSEPPSFRRLSPRSMTRLHLAAVAAPDR